MGEIFARLLDFAKELWPFRTVEPWEQGFYLVLNRPWRAVGPGIWPVVPFFMDVRGASVAEARVSTPLLNVRMADGRALSFSASARLRVTDAKAALINVESYQETSSEELAALLAEHLADIPVERFSTARRRRTVLAELLAVINERTRAYGVEVLELQFTNWIEGVKTYRLLNDSALTAPSLTW